MKPSNSKTDNQDDLIEKLQPQLPTYKGKDRRIGTTKQNKLMCKVIW